MFEIGRENVQLKIKTVKSIRNRYLYKINRALHGRLGIRILSSCAESISHE